MITGEANAKLLAVLALSGEALSVMRICPYGNRQAVQSVG